MTWQKTAMAELQDMGLSWGEAQTAEEPYVPLGTKRIST